MEMDKSIWDLFGIENSDRIARECILTSRALAELKGICRFTALPGIVKRHICLNEAKASRDIDNEPLDMGELLKAVVTKEAPVSEGAKEALRHMDIIERYSRNAPSAKTLEDACSDIFGHNVHLRISDENSAITNENEVVYRAPKGHDVLRLMEEFFEYVNSYEHNADELVVTCVAHLLFECIRPFEKGNGQAGRLLMHMLLNRYGLTDGCNVMICPSILRHRERYFNELRNAERYGRTEDWIIFMLGIIREGALETMSMIFSIQEMRREVAGRCENLAFFNNDLLNILFSDVYCKSSILIKAGIAERVTSMKYLKLLEQRGVLESEKVGRELVFRNIALYELMMK